MFRRSLVPLLQFHSVHMGYLECPFAPPPPIGREIKLRTVQKDSHSDLFLFLYGFGGGGDPIIRHCRPISLNRKGFGFGLRYLQSFESLERKLSCSKSALSQKFCSWDEWQGRKIQLSEIIFAKWAVWPLCVVFSGPLAWNHAGKTRRKDWIVSQGFGFGSRLN